MAIFEVRKLIGLNIWEGNPLALIPLSCFLSRLGKEFSGRLMQRVLSPLVSWLLLDFPPKTKAWPVALYSWIGRCTRGT